MGRRLAGVVGSCLSYGSDDPAGPFDVWLIDDQRAAVHIMTGSDWCLIVESSEPHASYDMGDSGLITVEAMGDRTLFANQIGKRVPVVREEHEPDAGCIALELSFPAGGLRCESWAGTSALPGCDDLAVAGVITASEPCWTGPFAGISPTLFRKLVTVLRRKGADAN